MRGSLCILNFQNHTLKIAKLVRNIVRPIELLKTMPTAEK